jgi:hypothetical protein
MFILIVSLDPYITIQSFHFARFGRMLNFHRILDDRTNICN